MQKSNVHPRRLLKTFPTAGWSRICLLCPLWASKEEQRCLGGEFPPAPPPVSCYGGPYALLMYGEESHLSLAMVGPYSLRRGILLPIQIAGPSGSCTASPSYRQELVRSAHCWIPAPEFYHPNTIPLYAQLAPPKMRQEFIGQLKHTNQTTFPWLF